MGVSESKFNIFNPGLNMTTERRPCSSRQGEGPSVGGAGSWWPWQYMTMYYLEQQLILNSSKGHIPLNFKKNL
jgi:hypothetical protein